MDENLVPPTYRYDRLRYADSFRVLVLEPSTDPAAPLHASLQEHRMLDDGALELNHYEAISYVWGEPLFSEAIFIDDLPKAITTNLSQALIRFRYSDTQRRLWVDQACIDQKNIEERGHQVRNMSEIYKRADRVLAWLGPGSPLTRIAMGNLDRLREDAVQLGFQFMPLRGGLPDVKSPEVDAVDARRKIYKKATEIHITTLYSQSWFTRLWIVQEAALAKFVLLTCGPDEIGFDTFAEVVILYRMASENHGSIRFTSIWGSESFTCFYSILMARSIYQCVFHDRRTPIFPVDPMDYLPGLIRQKCTNEHDRVYALLGILPQEFLVIRPDYSKSVVQVYKDFAKIYFDLAKWPRALEVVGRWRYNPKIPLEYGELSNPGYLPSWALDWRTSVTTRSLLGNPLSSSRTQRPQKNLWVQMASLW